MIELWPIPVLSDNYVWVLERPGCPRVAVVDPGEAGPVLAALSERGLEVGWVLLTHHHGDHIAGVRDISTAATPVFGPGQIGTVTRPLADGDRVVLDGLELELEVAHVPGHTLSHLAYLGPELALVGDTLFAGGCGRLFEGTPEQMLASLDRLAELPPSTAVYCAHEYTVANLTFARRVEPLNRDLATRLDTETARRERGEPTVPSSIATELATNPFLRSRVGTVIDAAGRVAGRLCRPGAETFAAIRAWKDRS